MRVLTNQLAIDTDGHIVCLSDYVTDSSELRDEFIEIGEFTGSDEAITFMAFAEEVFE